MWQPGKAILMDSLCVSVNTVEVHFKGPEAEEEIALRSPFYSLYSLIDCVFMEKLTADVKLSWTS